MINNNNLFIHSLKHKDRSKCSTLKVDTKNYKFKYNGKKITSHGLFTN